LVFVAFGGGFQSNTVEAFLLAGLMPAVVPRVI
jgi:hypothetical protein